MKVVPIHSMEACSKSGSVTSFILNFKTRWMSVFKFVLQLSYPLPKCLSHWPNLRLGGPQGHSGDFDGGKISPHCQKLKCNFSVAQPTAHSSAVFLHLFLFVFLYICIYINKRRSIEFLIITYLRHW